MHEQEFESNIVNLRAENQMCTHLFECIQTNEFSRILQKFCDIFQKTIIFGLSKILPPYHVPKTATQVAKKNQHKRKRCTHPGGEMTERH